MVYVTREYIINLISKDNGKEAILSDLELDYLNLSNIHFKNVKFLNCNLYCTNFENSTFENCKFVYCKQFNHTTNVKNVKIVGKNTIRNNCSYDNITEDIYNVFRRTPAEGFFTAYKKVKYFNKSNNYEYYKYAIVTLMIPANAKRSDNCNEKCRASEAYVLKIQDLVTKRPVTKTAFSGYNASFIYKVGDVVKPKNRFCNERGRECAAGIHFFMTREEAEEYDL